MRIAYLISSIFIHHINQSLIIKAKIFIFRRNFF